MATNAIAVRLKSDNYYKELFKNFKLDDFIDVILWAEGRSVPAHRCILAAASSVFHDMLKVCNNHGQMPMLVLDGVKYEHLCRLVEYLYCGKTQVAASELNEFFLSVKKYNILGLYEPSTPYRFPRGPSMFRAQRSLDDGDDDVVEIVQSQTGPPEHRGNKRKIVESPSKSLDERWQESIRNVSKRTCSPLSPQSIVDDDGTQRLPLVNNSPTNRSPSVNETMEPTTEEVATPKSVGQFASDDVRRAMIALNTKDFKHPTVILVAKEMGHNIANNKKAIQSLCGKMVSVAKTIVNQSAEAHNQ